MSKYYRADFILTFDNNRQILIEIKGILNIWNNDNKEYIDKIVLSGWTKEYIILGANHNKSIVGIGNINNIESKIILKNINDQWIFDNFIDCNLNNDSLNSIWNNITNKVQWKNK